jgi:hypothetical protein
VATRDRNKGNIECRGITTAPQQGGNGGEILRKHHASQSESADREFLSAGSFLVLSSVPDQPAPDLWFLNTTPVVVLLLMTSILRSLSSELKYTLDEQTVETSTPSISAKLTVTIDRLRSPLLRGNVPVPQNFTVLAVCGSDLMRYPYLFEVAP